ncbi:hypothetical protein [Caulobacter vibrioides]|uniref:hypothetical protein n=1 Tax=Caulobacter vibrioides TaxID=155892 RepID=UPI0013DDACD8|nr:hypothetical protein [Caulobacter vibrioides]
MLEFPGGNMASTKTKLAAVVAAILAVSAAGAAMAEPAAASWLDNTEKLRVEKTGGGKLGKANYALGEFTGVGGLTVVRTSGFSVLEGAYSSVKKKYDNRFTVLLPGQTEHVDVTCTGGQARAGLTWVAFKRSKLAYHCDYVGGGVPAGTAFDLALSEPGFMKSLEQPQRAGEFILGDIVLKAETRQVDTKLISSPTVLGYVFSRGGVDVCAISFAGWKKTIYLPKAGDPNRTACALLALSLNFFNDLGNL